jgi:hypothetical protein
LPPIVSSDVILDDGDPGAQHLIFLNGRCRGQQRLHSLEQSLRYLDQEHLNPLLRLVLGLVLGLVLLQLPP